MCLLLSVSLFPDVVFLLVILSPFVDAYKYFQEPRGGGLHHYDARFYREKVAPEKRADTLSELIVGFLEIMESEGIVVWLAHGTLMGWYWNGLALPWDWDVDMQLDVMSLQTLAEEYNQTIWTAIPSNAGPDAEPRDYFLDVNPYWVERVHGDGANFIDARFIDTRNGLYVDITALTELNPETSPNVVSCKNFHNYRLQDIYPLRESVFEGTKAKIPFNYKTVLADEYGQRSLVLANYNGYVWDRDISEWRPKIEFHKPYRLNGIASTPPTRIIPDEELPYFDQVRPAALDPLRPPLPSKADDPKASTLVTSPQSAVSSSSISIELEELPADRIDTPNIGGKGSILTTFWQYLTLFWRN